MSSFAERLVRWQAAHGRHGLPWQCNDPYRVWLSEIMLQQTQVATVIPYYTRFVESFPDVATLAGASLDQVLAHWAGLGYYSRARNLHAAAGVVVDRFGGRFPTRAADLVQLPGIGRSTAAAMAGFCAGERAAILDGNVKRVLARWAGVAGQTSERAVEQRLWCLAEALLPASGDEMPAYTQGMMDLGATVCTRSRPQCPCCPVRQDCRAHIEGRQAELPTPKPRKAKPERSTTMLLVKCEGRILLERRPPAGIWGGLWSLPEATTVESATECCRERYGLEVGYGEVGPRLRHTFTHFHLDITPLCLTLVSVGDAVQDETTRWFTPAEALRAGIPTPVRKLLRADMGASDGTNG